MGYIDRDDLLKAAWDKPTLSLSVYDIGNIKPVDIATVRHGWWERVDIAGEDHYECSYCGDKVSVWGYRYCPNCGAKMGIK